MFRRLALELSLLKGERTEDVLATMTTGFQDRDGGRLEQVE
jgi:hypothetical protein